MSSASFFCFNVLNKLGWNSKNQPMIWINLEQISSNPLSFRSPTKVYQLFPFPNQTKSIPKQKSWPSTKKLPHQPPKTGWIETKRPPEPVLLKEPNLPRPLLKASYFSERKGAGRAFFFATHDIYLFLFFFWRVWRGFLCSAWIKIKDHNKQVDLTFHFTQLKKVMLSKPHLKGTWRTANLDEIVGTWLEFGHKKGRQWDGVFDQLIWRNFGNCEGANPWNCLEKKQTFHQKRWSTIQVGPYL